jgi:uncharacterized protein
MDIVPVQLLVFQPTLFCNLNCHYCYLPDRKDARVMEVETVRATVEKLDRERLLAQSFSVIWHAGEPMLVGRQIYAEYFAAIQETLGTRYKVRHHFQTNGTLIDDPWCEFVHKYDISVGVSIDGPEYIHDRQRQTRSGRGTFRKTLSGIEKLQDAGVRFHTISVVSRYSAGFASEIYQFLVSLKPDFIGFNVEEQEGIHVTSSIQGAMEEVERFFKTVYELAKATNFSPPVREFESAFRAIQVGDGDCHNSQISPYEIFSVGVDGGFTTFSPELLGMKSSPYGSLNLGNILTDSPREISRSEKMSVFVRSIRSGVRRCRDTCEYFSLCGGGAPSNKLFEKGSFDVAATRFCESSIKVPLRIVLEDLESLLVGYSASP